MKNSTEAPEKDIVSFNQALELCSLGFDEPTFCMYEIENRQLCLCYIDEDGLYMPLKDFHAPTKSQVLRWLREKLNLTGIIEGGYTEGKNVFGYVIWLGHLDFWADYIYDTYEEAENACIDKLIEICKQQDNGKSKNGGRFCNRATREIDTKW